MGAGNLEAKSCTCLDYTVVSKNPTAMTNEVLCKVIGHNLTCLIQEQESLGIVPVFWKDEQECRHVMGPVAFESV
jgi:hypothetical protein